MSKGTINKVIIIGRLGKSPELRYMPSGMAVANISVATNDGYKDAQTGQFIDQTQWHRVSVFGKQAETLDQFTGKGNLLYIEGKLKTRKWQDKVTGKDQYATDIIAIDMQMLGSADKHNNASVPDYIPEHAEASQTQASAENEQQNPSNQAIKPAAPTLEDINAMNDEQPPF